MRFVEMNWRQVEEYLTRDDDVLSLWAVAVEDTRRVIDSGWV